MTKFIDMATRMVCNLDYIKVKEAIYKLNTRIRCGYEVHLNELWQVLDIPAFGLEGKIFNSMIEMQPNGEQILIHYKIV